MTPIAPYLSTFLREHLPRERRASHHTCEAYAYAFQLLLTFASRRFKSKPSSLELEQLDAPLILSFLEHLERDRGNSPKTRNARLAAIHAFFRFLEYRLPFWMPDVFSAYASWSIRSSLPPLNRRFYEID